MEYRETAIQLVLIIAILTGILIKLLASIVIGLYRDLTAGYRENELTFLHKLFYAVLSVGGLAILFMAGVAIISGGRHFSTKRRAAGGSFLEKIKNGAAR